MRHHEAQPPFASRDQLRVDRETVRVLRVRTGVRTGDNSSNGGLTGTQAAALTINPSGPAA